MDPENPMYNAVVISTMAKYMDYTTLASSRLVCGTWDAALFSQFQRRCVLNMEFNIVDKPMKEFTTVFTAAGDNHGRYFENAGVNTPAHLQVPMMADWMRRFGSHFKFLMLTEEAPNKGQGRHEFFKEKKDNPKSYQIECKTFQQLMSVWCTNLTDLYIPLIMPNQIVGDDDVLAQDFVCPKLKFIYLGTDAHKKCTLLSGTSSGQEQVSDIDVLLSVIIYASKSLAKIGLADPSYSSTLPLTTAALKSPPEGAFAFSSLTALELGHMRLQPKFFSELALARDNHKLQNLVNIGIGLLKLPAGNLIPSQECFDRFFKAFGPQLTSFILGITHDSKVQRLTIGPFTAPLLTSLLVRVCFWNVGGVDNLFENSPVLKKLDLRCCKPPKRQGPGPGNQPPHGGKHLRILHAMFEPTAALAAESRRYGQLQTLRVRGPIDSATMDVIVERFPSIKNLGVMASSHNLEFGGTIRKLEGLKKLRILCLEMMNCSLTPTSFEQGIVGLAQLNLYQVNLTAVGNKDVKLKELIHLTEKSIQNGILKSNKLKYLHLYGIKINMSGYKLLTRSPNISLKMKDCLISVHQRIEK